MKKQNKMIISLIVVTILLGTIAFAGGTKATIEVMLNSVNLTVNGQKVEADTIVFNGTTYVPLRAAAEMLDKDVGWDQATQTASINDKKAPVSKDGVKLYEDENVRISYLQLTSKGVEFMVENKTDNVLTIQADTIAINGLSVSEYIVMSDDVSPKSKGKVTARFSTNEFKDKVETISGQLKIIDFNSLYDTYTAKFVNAKVD